MNDFAAGCRRRPKRISFGSFLGSWLLLFERAGWLEGGATHLPGKRWKVRYCLQLSPVRCAQLEVRRRRWRGDSSRTTNKQVGRMEGSVHTLQLAHQLTASKTPVVRWRSWNELTGRWPAMPNAAGCMIIRFSWRVDIVPLGMDTCVTPATCLPYASYHLLPMILLLAWFW